MANANPSLTLRATITLTHSLGATNICRISLDGNHSIENGIPIVIKLIPKVCCINVERRSLLGINRFNEMDLDSPYRVYSKYSRFNTFMQTSLCPVCINVARRNFGFMQWSWIRVMKFIPSITDFPPNHNNIESIII